MENRKLWKVLIVDDDNKWINGYEEWVRELIKENSLEKQFNHSIERANDGMKASELIKNDKDINLVISDVFMSPYYENEKPTEELFGGLWLAMQINSIRSGDRERNIRCLLVSDKKDADVYFGRIPTSWKENGWLKFVAKEKGLTKENLQGKAYEAIAELADISEDITQLNRYAIIGESPQIKKILGLAKEVAGTNATVLLLGESGTGKELFARFIRANSMRENEPFIAINCGAIPESLLESELFGHEKGAFTGAHERKIGKFEVANGGTLFLDEIGDMSQTLQVKLLRVLQERQLERVGGNENIAVDIRIIAATKLNLPEKVIDRSFREDLYYRLEEFPLSVPPLRERTADIPLIADHLRQKFNEKHEKNQPSFKQKTLEAMSSYNWPGNVRELENKISRAVILGSEEVIVDAIKNQLSPLAKEDVNLIDVPDEGLSFSEETEKFAKSLIVAALKKTGGNKSAAARLLKLPERKFTRWCKEYGL